MDNKEQGGGGTKAADEVEVQTLLRYGGHPPGKLIKVSAGEYNRVKGRFVEKLEVLRAQQAEREKAATANARERGDHDTGARDSWARRKKESDRLLAEANARRIGQEEAARKEVLVAAGNMAKAK
jgi:cobalamin biosynthesis protein CbiD